MHLAAVCLIVCCIFLINTLRAIQNVRASLEDKGEMVLNCRKRKEGMNLFEAFKFSDKFNNFFYFRRGSC